MGQGVMRRGAHERSPPACIALTRQTGGGTHDTHDSADAHPRVVPRYCSARSFLYASTTCVWMLDGTSS